MAVRTIQIEQCREDFISRIPGLLPYIEYDDNDIPHIYCATENPNGCYGKVVPNLPLDLETGELITIKMDDQQSLAKVSAQGGDEQTQTKINTKKPWTPYRDLMNRYYEILNKTEITENEKKFKENIEKWIGIEYIDINGFPEDCSNVPDIIYLVLVDNMIDVYTRLQKSYWMWAEYADKDILAKNGNYSKICQEAQEYYALGGDTMLAKLKGLSNIKQTRSKLIFNYLCAKNDVQETRYNVCVNLFSTTDEMGMVTPYIDYYEPGNNYPDTSIVVDDEYKSGIVTKDGVITNNDKSQGTDGNRNIDELYFPQYQYKRQIQKITRLKLTGKTSSRLTSLRRGAFVSLLDSETLPDKRRDFLYYYRTGLVKNIKAKKDELGNIELWSRNGNTVERKTTMSDIDTNLHLFGDVIESISFDHNTRNVTIVYRIDEHLKATLKEIKTDADGNTFYYYTNIELDTQEKEEDYVGIKYTDVYRMIDTSAFDETVHITTYVYKDGEVIKYLGTYTNKDAKPDITDLSGITKPTFAVKVAENEFHIYEKKDTYYQLIEVVSEINQNVQEGEDTITVRNVTSKEPKLMILTSPTIFAYEDEYNKYLPYEMDTSIAIETVTSTHRGITTSQQVCMTTFETYVNKQDEEILNVPTYRGDYFLGATVQPGTTYDVDIDRGNAAAFEKFLKLGEIKTFDDLQSYGNYGYFTMK